MDKAIPINPPYHTKTYKLRKSDEIQSKLMLATNWTSENDPTGWYVFRYFFIFLYLLIQYFFVFSLILLIFNLIFIFFYQIFI